MSSAITERPDDRPGVGLQDQGELTPSVALGLLFLLAPLRHETDVQFRNLAVGVLGGAGALMALVGLLGGTIHSGFLMPFGILLAILGLVYLTSFVAARGTGDDVAFKAG